MEFGKIKSMPWPKVFRGERNVLFNVTLNWPIVDGEKILVATFMHNKNGHRYSDFLGIRIVCSKKQREYALYFNNGSRIQKKNCTLRNALDNISGTYPLKSDIKIAVRDEKALGRWLQCDEEEWFLQLKDWTELVLAEKKRDAKQNQMDDEVLKYCPEELPAGMVEYIRNTVLPEDNVLLYKKGGLRGLCYHCHSKVTTIRSNSFQQNRVMRCPNCGAVITCYLETSARFKVDYVNNIATVQRGLDGRTIFIRHWHINRDHSGEWNDIGRQLDEISRYAIRGNKVGKWLIEVKDHYFFQSQRYRLNEWQRIENVTDVYDGIYYFYVPGNFRELVAGTSLQYCPPEALIPKNNPIRMIVDWVRYPAIEKLYKAGFTMLVREKVTGFATKEYKSAVHWSKNSIQEALRLPLHLLQKKNVAGWNHETVCLMQKLMNRIKNEQDLWLLFDKPNIVGYITTALGHASAHKVVKYAEALKKEDLQTYADYLRDCEKLELNLDDTTVLFPKNLDAAHIRTISMISYRENQELAKKFEKQRKRLDRLRFEENGLTIRPAATEGELIVEGKTLHHCVAGYSKSMAEGKTAIFLIRRAEMPDVPFYTLEYRNGAVVQCRKKSNVSYVSEPEIYNFVQDWLAHIQKKTKKQRVAVVTA